MLGDVLLLSKKHKKIAEQLLEHIANLSESRPIIAISGESGSGKSEIAHYLAEVLKENGKKAKLIHIDNYYKIPPQNRKEWRQANGLSSIGDQEYDWDYINNNIMSFKTKTKAILPCLDRLTDQLDQLITDFKEIDILILEGLYAIKAEANLRIMLDITYHNNTKTQLRRGKEQLDDFRLAVLEREHDCVSDLREKADIFITKNFKLRLSCKKN